MHSSSLLSYYTFSLEKFNVVLGIILNGLLLLLIKRYSSAYFGNYKYLLAVFATFDIYLCLMHGLLNPVAIFLPTTFASSLYLPWPRHWLTSVYYASYTIPFALMNIHFLYRYWSVAHPTRIERFTQLQFLAPLSLYPICQAMTWFFMAMSLRKESGDVSLTEAEEIFFASHNDSIDCWLVMDHWRFGQLNVHVLCIVISTLTIMVVNFTPATMLATNTYKHILKATTLSAKHRSVQYTLLAAVCAQTFVPVLCVYIPYLLAILFPLLSLPTFGLAQHFLELLALFPGWDAIVIIVMIKDYRLGLLTMLGLRHSEKVIPLNTQFTVSTRL